MKLNDTGIRLAMAEQRWEDAIAIVAMYFGEVFPALDIRLSRQPFNLLEASVHYGGLRYTWDERDGFWRGWSPYDRATDPFANIYYR